METKQSVVKCQLETRIAHILRSLTEQDISSSEDELIIRNADELLLVREFREQRLEDIKKKARERLKS